MAPRSARIFFRKQKVAELIERHRCEGKPRRGNVSRSLVPAQGARSGCARCGTRANFGTMCESVADPQQIKECSATAKPASDFTIGITAPRYRFRLTRSKTLERKTEEGPRVPITVAAGNQIVGRFVAGKGKPSSPGSQIFIVKKPIHRETGACPVCMANTKIPAAQGEGRGKRVLRGWEIPMDSCTNQSGPATRAAPSSSTPGRRSSPGNSIPQTSFREVSFLLVRKRIGRLLRFHRCVLQGATRPRPAPEKATDLLPPARSKAKPDAPRGPRLFRNHIDGNDVPTICAKSPPRMKKP